MFPLIKCCSLRELFLSLKTKIQVVFALLIIRKFGKNVVWFWQPAGTLWLYRMQFAQDLLFHGLLQECISKHSNAQIKENGSRNAIPNSAPTTQHSSQQDLMPE